MSYLRVLICRIEDEPGKTTELAHFDLPSVDPDNLEPEKTLDQLEDAILSHGQQIMRSLLEEQWRNLDSILVARHHEAFPPEAVIHEGYSTQRVACRLGIIHLSRQICFNRELDHHLMPGNALLPEHNGTIITRSLQEWACLLPMDLPFATVERLLKWQAQCPEMICASEVRRLVSAHGEVIREAEAEEVKGLLDRKDLSGLKAQLVSSAGRRAASAWPPELTDAVRMALERGDEQPPEGVRQCDWERILAARRQEYQCMEQLRRLGPEIRSDQVVAATDDVLIKAPEKNRMLSIRTARIATTMGFRYLSGNGEAVLNQIFLLLILCGAPGKAVLLLGDGARWIRTFFTDRLKIFSRKELILDWFHLKKKCYELCSMICRGRKARASLMGRLIPCLWRGNVAAAVTHLEDYRHDCRNEQKLDELIRYLDARKPYIPNYKDKRAHRFYIGSGHAEKACDLIVARRQKHKGMHWSEKTADGLAALRTLMLNRAWDLYWQDRKILSLAINA